MKVFLIGGVPSDGDSPTNAQDSDLLKSSAREIARSIAAKGHDLLVCSPFDGSIDVEAIRGAAQHASLNAASMLPAVECHYPQAVNVQQVVDLLESGLRPFYFDKHPHVVPRDEQGNANWSHAWLLCQLAALDRSHCVVALGGKPKGSASLLLFIAEQRRVPVLPLTFLRGAAEQSFTRRQFEIRDRLGDRMANLHATSAIGEVAHLAELLVHGSERNRGVHGSEYFFISYSRQRPEDADHVETILRRRNCLVFRDERNFEPGNPIAEEVLEHIHRATVFVALWRSEYACSPWCFDELALERRKSGLSVWVLLCDQTRIVPPAARSLLTFRVHTREELEGRIIELLDRRDRESVSPIRRQTIERTPE